jgi:hypothetical protein
MYIGRYKKKEIGDAENFGKWCEEYPQYLT